MKVLSPIMTTLAVLAGLATGGILSAVFIALDSQYNWTSSLTTDVVSAATKLTNEIDPNGSSYAQNALNAFIQVVIVSLLFVAVSWSSIQ